jgi:hypothetical protein
MADILDVAIGLVFFYLVLSLVVTAANELFAAWFRRRAWMLSKGIKNLLDDDALAQKLYSHPLIRSLRQSSRGPSYIPSRTFAVALLDIVAPIENGKRKLPSKDNARGTVDYALALLWEEAGEDVEKLKENIEVWFNNSMERVSGWYKRRTQMFLLLWAIVVTVGTNADTIVIANALWRDPALRQSLVARAERYVAENRSTTDVSRGETPGPPPLPPDRQAEVDFQDATLRFNAAFADLNELNLPIGWRDLQKEASAKASELPMRLVRADARAEWPGAIWPFGGNDEWGRWVKAFDDHTLGWLLTVFAVSLGAPFWFDTLNRIISIRSAGKAPEEKPKAPKKVPQPKEPGEAEKA